MNVEKNHRTQFLLNSVSANAYQDREEISSTVNEESDFSQTDAHCSPITSTLASNSDS